MRVSRQATVVWGVVQLGVAIGAQWMDRSVLDAGLAVLSFASGAVLGAFLLGTLMPRVAERDALAGMIAGLVTMTFVWGWTTVAFTWYVFIGATTTCLVAWLLSRLDHRRQPRLPCPRTSPHDGGGSDRGRARPRASRPGLFGGQRRDRRRVRATVDLRGRPAWF